MSKAPEMLSGFSWLDAKRNKNMHRLIQNLGIKSIYIKFYNLQA